MVVSERFSTHRESESDGTRESVFPTMVLLGLGTTWGCTQWLHREDYTVFELGDNRDGKVEGASVASSRVRASADEPSQYWLIGFKDRRLEREYREDLVEASSSCFLVGSALTLLLYIALPLALALVASVFSSIYEVENGLAPLGSLPWTLLLPTIVGGLGFLAAFIVCCVHSMGKWKVRKDVILYVIEGSYLLYTGSLICIGMMNDEGMRFILLSFAIALLTLFFLCRLLRLQQK